MHEWPEIDWTELRDHRWSRTREAMRGRGLDHLLLTGPDNIRYVTGFRVQLIAEGYDWFAAVVGPDGESDVFVPWIDEVQRSPEPGVRQTHPVPSWAPAVTHQRSWVRALAGALRGAKRVGYEMINPEILDGLREELPDVEFAPIAAELFAVRKDKHPSEIALLAAAAEVNALAAREAIEAAEPGMTDFDVLAVAMASLQRAGVEYLTHSLCNHRRGTGTWFAAGSTLREGDAFFFDIGCHGAGGYASDIARTGFVGEPPAAVARAYKTLLEAHEVGQRAARPGVRASEVDAAVNRHLERAGLPTTPYAVGHGIGLRACEPPTIYRPHLMDRDETLREGQAISLEPETGVTVGEEFVLLKVEDNFAVERDGLRILSR